jgi:hypothetical protein
MEKFGFTLLATALIALAFLGTATASSTGVATIRLNNTHATFYLNTSEIFAYNVTLYNGTAGETYLGIGTSSSLLSDGIQTGLTPGAGVPPFTGTLYVKVLENATAGNYTVPIGSVGADPSNHGIAVLYMTVLPYNKPSTTTTTVKTTTTIPSNSSATTSVAPTTTVPSSVPPTTSVAVTTPSTSTYANTTVLYIIVSVVVIVIVIALVVYAWNRRR